MGTARKAEREDESLKKHGDVLDSAVKDSDRKAQGGGDPIPMPENGSHERSHAAHLGGTAHDHTHREGTHPGAFPGELRQPPQEVSRVGKEHRKQ